MVGNPNGHNEEAFWAGLDSSEVYPDWGTPPTCTCGSHKLAPLYHGPDCPLATPEQRRKPVETFCIDCGQPTIPGKGSARCAGCWEDRCGQC